MVATVIAGVGAAAGLYGAISSAEAASDARRQGDKAAEQERLATEERIRRLGRDRDLIIGAQRAGAAAGNVDVASRSVNELRAETIREFETQMAFTRRAGAFAAQSAEIQGESASYQYLASGLQSLAGALRITHDSNFFGLGPKNQPTNERTG
ncbi:hypothetical protein [Lentisalinibacter orientalis]|uniref:hypothetical protein n=1 Tax=Lentisalinibacter orientalis TaxID=2992241 RepID=UPI00386BD981